MAKKRSLRASSGVTSFNLRFNLPRSPDTTTFKFNLSARYLTMLSNVMSLVKATSIRSLLLGNSIISLLPEVLREAFPGIRRWVVIIIPFPTFMTLTASTGPTLTGMKNMEEVMSTLGTNTLKTVFERFQSVSTSFILPSKTATTLT